MSLAKWILVGLSCLAALAVVAEAERSQHDTGVRENFRLIRSGRKLPSYFALIGVTPPSACLLN